MLTRIRWIPAVLVLIFAAVLTVRLVTALSAKHGGENIKPTSPDSPDASIEDFSYIQEGSGGVGWQVRAKRAEIFEADHRARLLDVHVRVDRPGGDGLSVSADEGLFDTLTKNVVIRQYRGLLRLRLDNGYIAETRQVAWDQRAKEMSSPDPVRILGPNVDIQGIGFVLNATARSLKVVKDVRVAITP